MSTEDLPRMRAACLEQARSIFVAAGRFDPSVAWLHCLNNEVHLMAMPGLSEQEQREQIQKLAAKEKAWLVHHAREVWSVAAPVDDPVAVERIRTAQARYGLDRHPERTEALILFEETLFTDPMGWKAPITRGAHGAPLLAPWLELKLTLPRPGFKRYLSEELPRGIASWKLS